MSGPQLKAVQVTMSPTLERQRSKPLPKGVLLLVFRIREDCEPGFDGMSCSIAAGTRVIERAAWWRSEGLTEEENKALYDVARDDFLEWFKEA